MISLEWGNSYYSYFHSNVVICTSSIRICSSCNKTQLYQGLDWNVMFVNDVHQIRRERTALRKEVGFMEPVLIKPPLEKLACAWLAGSPTLQVSKDILGAVRKEEFSQISMHYRQNEVVYSWLDFLAFQSPIWDSFWKVLAKQTQNGPWKLLVHWYE